ncbi:chondroitinase family polysaccharide lyase [Paenibacillus yanchengensis]|uniref:Chondroitinase family polysaccharide lyase n=1 Tax=Paenibacillus yanchengensis TaxID=2035833 RepID=A0ABW4YQA2_9BACL
MESFETNSWQVNWSATNNGTLEQTSDRFKDGQHSLVWNWTSNGAKVQISSHPELAAANVKNGGLKLWIYNELEVDDVVTFQFGTYSEIAQQNHHFIFQVRLKFTGWRAIWVKLREEGYNSNYTGTHSSPLEVMEIVAPASVSSGKLYFDNVEFLTTIVKRRSEDYQLPKPGIDVGASSWDNVYYYSQQQPTIPLKPEITQAEIDGFEAIANKYEQWIYGDNIVISNIEGPLLARYNALQQYITQGLQAYSSLNIVRHIDGRITGKPLYAQNDPQTPKFGDQLSRNVLLPLVYDYKWNGNISSKQKYIDALDYMHDQGWADGSAIGTLDHESNRHSGYFHSVFLMRNELIAVGKLDRELSTIFWYGSFGRTFDHSVYIETTADEIRTKFIYLLLYVLAMEHTPKKVQYMEGLMEWYEQGLQVVPGYADLFKPDGTMFHHRAVYLNAYGEPALQSATLLAYLLHGTVWQLSHRVYSTLKNSLLTLEKITNSFTMPIGATGRFPDKTNIAAYLFSYVYLASASTPIDSDLAARFKRQWQPDSPALQAVFRQADAYGVQYLDTLGGLQMAIDLAQQTGVPKINPQGVWMMPYGAMAVNRIHDYVAATKGFGQYTWNAEMTNKENVYGYYQNFGNLLLIGKSEGDSLKDSGIHVGAGWDWSRWPGTTIKTMPLSELVNRFNYSRIFTESTFVGGVTTADQYGFFSLLLQDPVDPTFSAHKSMFFFGDLIVCVGSNINNTDQVKPTETILFQSYMSHSAKPFWHNNSAAITASAYDDVQTTATMSWLVDPYGHGYIIPNGKGVTIKRGLQTSRSSTDKQATSGYYTTAYIQHDYAPQQASYEYAIKVGAGASVTASYAMDRSYTILQNDQYAHIVKQQDNDVEVIGYAIFDHSLVVDKGILYKSSDPLLVMEQRFADGTVQLSIADPDLRLGKHENNNMPFSVLTQSSMMKTISLTIIGEWDIVTADTSIRLVLIEDNYTTIEIDAIDGKSYQVTLHSLED